MTIGYQREGTYISNQVRMYACHLTSKYCKYFLIVTGKILNEIQQDCGQRKNHSVDDK
jgi:hypothetical protein